MKEMTLLNDKNIEIDKENKKFKNII